MNIDYSKITDNPKLIELLKQRIKIENKIKDIDETALIKHELELLSLLDVVSMLNCDGCIWKGGDDTLCGNCGDDYKNKETV